MSGAPQQTLGALLARLEVRERRIAVEAEAAHEQIMQLTALLDGLTQAAEHIAITRKTLLELTDEAPLAPAEPAAALPDGPAYQQIMAVFAERAQCRRSGACPTVSPVGRLSMGEWGCRMDRRDRGPQAVSRKG
ncbi:hypothetical protein OK074_4164 [Actinobacteria bacterium OK074]|nr:hypothetical protein OK074_4164 [Actinobacteria bacterium OK074]